MKMISTLKFSLIAIILVGCGFLLVATTEIKDPEVKYIDHHINKVTSQLIHIDVNLMAHNPNAIGLKNVFVNYEVYTQGKRLIRGNDVAITLSPNQSTTIKVPVQIRFKEVLGALGPLYKNLIGKKQHLSVEIRAIIYGKPTVYNESGGGSLFSFHLQENKIIKIPLPRNKIDELKQKAKKAFQKLF